MEGAATDDIGVVMVRLYVDGVLVQATSSAAFSMRWDPSGEGTYVLQVMAEDAAGKTGSATTVVTIKP